MSLGELPEDTLYGDVNVVSGIPSGSVQASDLTESFSFDCATRTADYAYDYGYHGASDTFSGMLSLVGEPGAAALMLIALLEMVRRGRRVAASERQDRVQVARA